jgi:D-alanyl-D-alanine carboxypeptidase (penicillin-binding protein 5/6)
MKKLGILCLLLCFLVSLALPAAAADMSVEEGCHSVDAQRPLTEGEKLTSTATAAMIYERGSDTMIYADNPDGKIYPASMVKLMTALVALEKGDLSDEVTVTKRALNLLTAGAATAGLVAGEELTLEQLLYCLMVGSANDAALVIAEHIGGNQDIFVAMMNQKAEELGCTGTHFSNAHGLHDEETYTTARDICRITDAALENEVFRAMFTMESYTVPATNKSEERVLWTTNHMMSTHTRRDYFDNRVTGGKTGATDEAGRCLVATAETGGMELITIVMGAKPQYTADGLSVITYGSFEETRVLLDHAFSAYECRQIFLTGQSLFQYPVQGGASHVVAGPADDAMTVLPKKLDPEALTWRRGEEISLSAPVTEGQTIATVQAWYEGKCLAQTQLVALHAVPVQQAPEQVAPPEPIVLGTFWKVVLIVLGAVLGVVLLGVLVLLTARWIRRAAYTAKLRRRSQYRRRER